MNDLNIVHLNGGDRPTATPLPSLSEVPIAVVLKTAVLVRCRLYRRAAVYDL